MSEFSIPIELVRRVKELYDEEQRKVSAFENGSEEPADEFSENHHRSMRAAFKNVLDIMGDVEAEAHRLRFQKSLSH